MRALCSIAVLATLVVAGAGARAADSGASPASGGRSVGIFYYPWYGTPVRDGGWQHWQQNENAPPKSIASGWYPMRGAYSSDDPHILRAQMREIAAAGIDTVIVSWWGPGSPEDARLTTILQAARAAGLGVAVHVEPYRRPDAGGPGRAARGAGSPGCDRLLHLRLDEPRTTPTGLALNARVAGLRLFANTGLPGKAKAGGFDGPLHLRRLHLRRFVVPAHVRVGTQLGLVCAPSVGPGYDARPCDRGPARQDRAQTVRHTTGCGAAQSAPAPTSSRSRATTNGTRAHRSSPRAASVRRTRRTTVPTGSDGRAAERAYLDAYGGLGPALPRVIGSPAVVE